MSSAFSSLPTLFIRRLAWERASQSGRILGRTATASYVSRNMDRCYPRAPARTMDRRRLTPSNPTVSGNCPTLRRTLHQCSRIESLGLKVKPTSLPVRNIPGRKPCPWNGNKSHSLISPSLEHPMMPSIWSFVRAS